MIESVAAEKNHRREERQTVQLPVENGSRVSRCIVHFIVVTVCERGSIGPWPRLSMATGGASAGPDVQVIKQSIAYRAKYRKGQGPTPCIKMFSPALAVPHPKNRGGDPVVSMRTRELGNFIAREGNDPMEAASSAVAVEGHAGKKCGLGHFPKSFRGADGQKGS